MIDWGFIRRYQKVTDLSLFLTTLTPPPLPQGTYKRKGHVRLQWEGEQLQIRKRGPTRNQPA
jgi:hypothetical protein